MRRPRTRPARPALLMAATVLALAGCSTFSDPSPSTGVDELVVPTPSPDPDDFAGEIDNPWFVLDGAAYADTSGAVVERTFAVGPDVLGVATTAVTTGDDTDLYAQDAAGNVWWFGREGEWRAGEGDAEAGLAMAAEPRRGDGYRRAAVPGRDLRANVVEVDDATVTIETVDGDVTVLERYRRGTGLETVETLTGEVVLARQGLG